MERDWELVRKILNTLESKQSTQEIVRPEEIEGYESEVVSYHIQILIEAGLIKGECDRAIGAPLNCYAERLTWDGHEFLDGIRSDTIWNKTKVLLKEKGISLSFEAISMAVKSLVSSML